MSARGAAGDQPHVESNGCRESKARKSGSHLTPRCGAEQIADDPRRLVPLAWRRERATGAAD
jgi:hypothetical protein